MVHFTRWLRVYTVVLIMALGWMVLAANYGEQDPVFEPAIGGN